MDVTPALTGKINDKIGSLIQKVGAETTNCAFTLRTHHADLTKSTKATKLESHIVEGVVTMKGGVTLKVEARSEDMYKSIDMACNDMSGQLKKYKDRLRTLKVKGGQKGKEHNMEVVVDPAIEEMEITMEMLDDFKDYAE